MTRNPLTTLLLLVAFWLVATAATVSLPISAKRDGITVRAQAGMDSIVEEVLRDAPEFLEKIAADLPGLPVPKTVEIRLVKRSTSLPLVAPKGRGAPAWASGVAYSDLGIVTVAYRNGGTINNLRSVVAHELAHLALGAAFQGPVPRWLNEGFANLHSSDWSMTRTETLTALAWSGNVISLEELEATFPERESQVHKAYAQSYDLVAFLARRGRYIDQEDDGDRWPFRNFLQYLAKGDSLNNAAIAAYGRNMNSLYGEWYESLRSRYLLVPGSLVSLFVWCLAAVLLLLAYRRKNRTTREILARWEAEERARLGDPM